MRNEVLYLGVDVAGASNTWIALIACDQDGNSRVAEPPRKASLREIASIADDSHVVAAVVDAQLTASLDDEMGFRNSDHELRAMLPSGCRNWVASINSLMAVPIRGQLIAAALGTAVGSVLETHPRACLFFASDRDDLREACSLYKSASPESIRLLWERWARRFEISYDEAPSSDGGLDALVCATIGRLFHVRPHALQKLGHDQPNRIGRGPFYILASTMVKE